MVRPSPLACIECRQQHLKCDARTPSCSRCMNAGLDCKYLPSRRGRNRKTRDGHRRRPSLGVLDAPRSDDGESLGEETLIDMSPSGLDGADKSHIPATFDGKGSHILPDASHFHTRLVRLFYENFHAAHPILVPAFEYERRQYPGFLQQVILFIGSHYSQQVSNNSLRGSTAIQLNFGDTKTPTMVQALLLYSIVLCARGESAEAQASFSKAVDIALALGMYRREFAEMYSNDQELEAESLRRTWWELTVVEVNIAAMQKKISLRCGSFLHGVALPCDESIYASNSSIPPATTLASFSKRVFSDNETSQSQYSSFSYRIEAACILARVLVLNSLGETHRDHMQAVENALVSWTNHLPPNKVEVVDTYGVVDEMLFQAHITIQYAAMLLHLPRSNLRPAVPDAGTVICPITPSRLPPSFTRHVHDIKATEASKQLSNLISMRSSVQRYSPFIICGLALCGMVQLATSRIHSQECAEHHRNRVVLVLGCLKVLRRNWPVVQQAYHVVRQAAAEAFTAGAGSHCFQSGADPPSSVKHDPGNSCQSNGIETAYLSGMDTSTAGTEALSPSLLSAYIDPTCSDPSFLSSIFDMDLT